MSNKINRREWLQKTTLLTGGATLLTSGLNWLSASPQSAGIVEAQSLSDFEFGRNSPPQLKARLFANENPFGPSEKAKAAIRNALDESFRYAIRDIEILTEKIAESEGVDKEMVLLSAGSSAMLAACAIYFSTNGGNIITGDPSYDDLPERASHLKSKWIKIPLTKDYVLDLDAMEKAVNSETRMVYICNPNNPTGTVVNTEKLRSFCERVGKKTTVFVDEAYIDYLPDPKAASMMDSVKKGNNVIVARTFSKLYGFAGLRVGYIIAQKEMLEKLQPYESGNWCISGPSLAGALAAYHDEEFLKSALQKTFASRDFLYKTLQKEGYEYIPSSANFVMFPIKMEGKRFTDEMFKRGVGVRFWKFNNKDWCRVSIGRMDEMQAFAQAFAEIS